MDPALAARLALSRYPRSARYDPQWMVDTRMGPNVLWLTEWLATAVTLPAGARVLDLGCGMAASSIFLAREFGVTVWAADLWIDPSDNWRRVRAAGLEDRVFPLRVEAHDLPFAHRFFDAVVSVDAYHYFGTADAYLPYLARFARREARFGMVVPGVRAELADSPPACLEPWWEADMYTFHTPDWWARHVGRHAAVERAEWLDGGHDEWLLWCDVCAEALAPTGTGLRDADEAAMLRADVGHDLGLLRVVARL